MAHSIDDIPSHLRTRADKYRFIAWLSAVPLTNSVKRSIIAAWRRHNGDGTFTAEDYRAALTPNPLSPDDRA